MFDGKGLYSKHSWDEKFLNKRTEFIGRCRDQNKLFLKNVKDSMD